MTEQELAQALEKVATEAQLRARYDELSRKQAAIEKEIEEFAAASRRQVTLEIMPERVDIERTLGQIEQLKEKILKDSPIGKQVRSLAEERKAVDFDKNGDPVRLGLITKIDRCIRERREGEAEIYRGQFLAAERRVRAIDAQINQLLKSIGLGPTTQFGQWDANVERLRKATIESLLVLGFDKEAKQYLRSVDDVANEPATVTA
jgi:hypothetical protein